MVDEAPLLLRPPPVARSERTESLCDSSRSPKKCALDFDYSLAALLEHEKPTHSKLSTIAKIEGGNQNAQQHTTHVARLVTCDV